MKKVTLNISDFQSHHECNEVYAYVLNDILCEIISNGVKIGEFSADGISSAASLDAIVAEKYGTAEYEADGKEWKDFDDKYIKDALYDYIERSEPNEIVEWYGDDIVKSFNEDFGEEFEVERVTCKPTSEFGFNFYGRY